MFRYRLALELKKTVRELEQVLTVKELAGWYAFYELDPFGELRGDIRASIGAAAICSAFGAKVSAEDLMPDFDHDPVQDQAAGLLAWQAYVVRHNAQNKKE